MTATRTNRFDPFALAQRELDTVFGRLVNGETTLRNNPVDVRETADGFILEADLPGFTRSQIDITLENNILTVVADRNLTTEPTTDTANNSGTEISTPSTLREESPANPLIGYHVRERRALRFERNFKLPPTIDESTITANLSNGVLTLQIAKRPETKPRKINVA